MQFGIFTVGDVTPDPTNGRVPTESERIKAMVTIADKAQEVGLDVFATGEHHNPVRAVLADNAARIHRRPDQAPYPLDRHHLDHNQRSGEDRRGLLDAPASGRWPGRPHARTMQYCPRLPVVR